MTDKEFETFARRLFISFPSLYEWLSGTLDPAATQAIWRDTLRPYSLADCLGVIDDWNTGRQKPFEAYERDKVHLIIRSMIGLQHDRERKRREVSDRSKDYKQLPNTPFTDSNMRGVYLKLSALKKRVLKGEVSDEEYERVHDEEFAKL
jgi:hypothetical protein